MCGAWRQHFQDNDDCHGEAALQAIVALAAAEVQRQLLQHEKLLGHAATTGCHAGAAVRQESPP